MKDLTNASVALHRRRTHMPSKKDRPRRDWLRIALDNIGDAVFALSPAGCVTFLNAAAERLTGIDPEVARQRPLTELIELRDEADRPFPLSDTGALPGTIRRRLRLTAADGSGKTVEATLEPVLATRPGSHDGASAVLVLDDLTARAQLEEELSRRAEELVAADRRKDQFLAMLAHDLRNPLAPIRNAVERVRANGTGVRTDVLRRVFEPFVQSDGSLARTEGGLGIGLTLVRSLVDMHGGSVEAHSPGLGQGSEFVIRLPVRVAAATAEPAAPHEARPFAPARPVRVLVVEDNVDAAESLATLLRIWGHGGR